MSIKRLKVKKYSRTNCLNKSIMNKIKLLIVIPCLNEENTLESVISPAQLI